MNKIDLIFEKDFIGKRVLVTGASKGLGAATCQTLASKGAKLAMISRSKKNYE